MALGTHDIAQLALTKPDGSGLTRVEAEKELWDKCKIVHNMRLLASYHFGLENRFALGMTPTSVIHWILDEMIRKRLIAGEQIGVQPELESDNSYFNTYIQRLRVFVENGQALMPKEGEGIDMGEFNQQVPPPGMPPQNGQMNGGQPQGFTPPPPPMAYPGQQAGPPPQQYAAPPQPQQPGYGPPPQQYAAPPQQGQFQQPPAPSFGPPPQQGFAPPPQQPSFPPQGAPPPVAAPPQMPPPGMPPQPQGAVGAPPAPPAQSPSNRRRGKAEGAPAAAPAPGPAPQMPAPQAGPPPGMPGFNGAPQPGGFGAPPAMPQFGAPQAAPQQMPAPQAAPAAGVSTEKLEKEVAALRGEVASLTKLVTDLLSLAKCGDQALSIILRPYYQKPMPSEPAQLSTAATFKEIGLPIPS